MSEQVAFPSEDGPEERRDQLPDQQLPAAEFLGSDETVVGSLGAEDLLPPDAPMPGRLGRTAIYLSGALLDRVCHTRWALDVGPAALTLHSWVVGEVSAYQAQRVIAAVRPQARRTEHPQRSDKRRIAEAVEEVFRAPTEPFEGIKKIPKGRVRANPHYAKPKTPWWAGMQHVWW